MSFHTDEAVLRYEHVDVSFEGCAVLHDISITLGRGEILAVVGESGCGKSTLLRPNCSERADSSPEATSGSMAKIFRRSPSGLCGLFAGPLSG